MAKKKTIITLLVIAIIIVLAGCDSTDYSLKGEGTEESQVEGKLIKVAGNNVCSEWVDMETGVHYFYTYKGGLSVRYNEKGEVMRNE